MWSVAGVELCCVMANRQRCFGLLGSTRNGAISKLTANAQRSSCIACAQLCSSRHLCNRNSFSSGCANAFLMQLHCLRYALTHSDEHGFVHQSSYASTQMVVLQHSAQVMVWVYYIGWHHSSSMLSMAAFAVPYFPLASTSQGEGGGKARGAEAIKKEIQAIIAADISKCLVLTPPRRPM